MSDEDELDNEYSYHISDASKTPFNKKHMKESSTAMSSSITYKILFLLFAIVTVSMVLLVLTVVILKKLINGEDEYDFRNTKYTKLVSEKSQMQHEHITDCDLIKYQCSKCNGIKLWESSNSDFCKATNSNSGKFINSVLFTETGDIYCQNKSILELNKHLPYSMSKMKFSSINNASQSSHLGKNEEFLRNPPFKYTLYKSHVKNSEVNFTSTTFHNTNKLSSSFQFVHHPISATSTDSYPLFNGRIENTKKHEHKRSSSEQLNTNIITESSLSSQKRIDMSMEIPRKKSDEIEEKIRMIKSLRNPYDFDVPCSNIPCQGENVYNRIPSPSEWIGESQVTPAADSYSVPLIKNSCKSSFNLSHFGSSFLF